MHPRRACNRTAPATVAARALIAASLVSLGSCSLTGNLDELSSGSAGAAPDGGVGGSAGSIDGGGSGGGAGTSGGDGGIDGPVVCADGETRCGNECVVLSMNLGHCGGCGAACTAPPDGTSVCVDGKCDFVCGSLLRCGPDCVDGDSDTENCGACGNECLAVPFGDPSCTSGSCGAQCDPGFDFCAGRCVDTQSDPDHCGACDAPCPTGEVCGVGTCTSSCPAGLTDCSGACVDPQGSVLHCGACGAPCTSPSNGTATCTAGACGVSCDPGFTECGGECVDTETSAAHCGGCGVACDSPANGSASCADGTCTFTCDAGFAKCADRCADLDNDPAHCGGCDQACAETEVCSQGACDAQCAGGLLLCAGLCVDTSSDPDHCGACDAGCPQPADGSAVCASGGCGISCDPGFTDCSGQCIATSNNPMACGSCTNVCPVPSNGSATCTSGTCGVACNAGFSECGGDCFDLQTSTEHCGSCPVACSGGQVCSNGTCTTSCAPGETDCGGSCVDTDSDPTHCGGCGSGCTNPHGSTACSGGVCVPTCDPGWQSCDGDPANGCEHDVSSDPANCGACGNVCPPSAAECRDGVCVPGPTTVTTAYFHTCASRPSGALACWGRNLAGQLGNGTTTESHVPVLVTGFTDAVQPATKTYSAWASSCGLHASGLVSCWGHREHGQLGDGNGISGQTTTKKTVVNLTDAVQISAGDDHVCAVRRTGAVVCWGDRQDGRLGNGGSESGYSDVPVTVTGITNAIQVSAGDRHSCAVLANGEIWCWGARNDGRLGDDATSPDALEPVKTHNITNAAQVSCGRDHTCAVMLDGTARCWGDNNDDRIGDGSSTTGNQEVPATVSGLNDAVQIAAGNQHSCAVRATGGVVCWGDRSDGRIGNGGSTASTSPTPVAVSTITDAVSVDAGDRHTCAMTTNGAVWCWGQGTDGKLGNNGTSNQIEPVQVVMLPP